MLDILLLVGLTAGVLWYLATPFRTGLWRFPGPWWRRYSDIFQVLDTCFETTRQSVQQLHAQYGDTVVIGPNTLIFSDPAMIDTVYGNRNPLPKSHHMSVMRHELNGVVFPNLVAIESTREHAILKRPIANVYSMSNVTKSERFINECIVLFVHQLTQEFLSKGKPMPVYQWAHFFGYDTVMKLTASVDFGLMRAEAQAETMFKGMTTALKVRAMGICMPWIYEVVKKSPFANSKAIMSRLGSFPTKAAQLINDRRARGITTTKTHDREDLLDQLLQTKEKFPDIVTEDVLHGYASTPVFAGGQPVAAITTAVIYFLGKNRSVASKLQAEIDSSGFQMPPQWAELQKMPYLEAVVRETMRYCPLAAALSRREVPPGRDFRLNDGRRVPAGTSVAVLGVATHFNKEIYGQDADTFRPERWLMKPAESPNEYAERLRWMNKADLTWGAGDRACLGKNIAKCEVYKLVATLYYVFDIKLLNPEKEWKIRETLGIKQEGVEAMLNFREGITLDQLRSVE